MRQVLAKTNKLSHAEFLQIVFADEVGRRDTTSAGRRARTAGLDQTMTLDRWDPIAAVTYDRSVWAELCASRFVDSAHKAIVMGPVGVDETFLASALGQLAVRRRRSVHFERSDRFFKRLRIARLDNSHDAELRKPLSIDVLIIDDFALAALDATATATADLYETVVERHRRGSTIITSNRDPIARSAIDRLSSAAHQLRREGWPFPGQPRSCAA